MKGAARRVAIEVGGWALVLVGIAALVLPGPGLLLIFAGVAVLSQQYEWAEKRLDPIKYRALKGAAESVETWVRIVFSSLVAVGLLVCGVIWIWSPEVPDWWSFRDSWWLPGGVATGITQIASGLFAFVLLGWSYRKFHGKPEAVAELEREIDEADEEFKQLRD
ncbi:MULTISPECIES: PGPGW domain-containing protein [Nocardioides]|uniref:Putative transmembrane protein (PGPGW) n=1 Tax=Nocardioides lianchengensis TaxID=1045774 RepID=A0A1G6ZUF5_9ACTN|nr:PGPGW domain-containing protein [Nocardioides lianchengensis]NYG12229.1 NADH:ubiquinone oxidoreductase subunit 5 (subunit L)/multisubunit Na+/H+ antiporter MnhA subunit [Nocardioides lianchengensis]SDE06171.1 Putative transmembrane protein (PGPGW) [Nocardioides lianchengensis]